MAVELEQIFLRLHNRVSRSSAAVFDASARRFIEWLLLITTILVTLMFLTLHVQYVGAIDSQSCMVRSIAGAVAARGGVQSVDLLAVRVSMGWTPMLDALRDSIADETLRLWCEHANGPTHAHGDACVYKHGSMRRRKSHAQAPPIIAAAARYLALQTEIMSAAARPSSRGIDVSDIAGRPAGSRGERRILDAQALLLQAMSSLHELLTASPLTTAHGPADHKEATPTHHGDPATARADVVVRAARRTLASLGTMRGNEVATDAAALYKSVLHMLVSKKRERELVDRSAAVSTSQSHRNSESDAAGEQGETADARTSSHAGDVSDGDHAHGARGNVTLFWRVEEAVRSSLSVLLHDEELLGVLTEVYAATVPAHDGLSSQMSTFTALAESWDMPSLMPVLLPVIDVVEGGLRAVAQFLWKPNKVAEEPYFLYSTDKGLLSMSATKRDMLDVRLEFVDIEARSTCVGSPLHRWLLHEFVGYDTAVLNSLIAAVGGYGYVVSQHAGEVHALSHASEVERFAAGYQSLLLFKIGTLCSAIFLLFAASSLVSFILAQTQQRMLRFTVSLQHHVRARLPLLPLVVSHLLDSLVFVPIMLGVLFFLFEFFSDQLLAFLVLLVVWLCELWSITSCRTLESLRVFPRVFGLLMTWFHVYYLTYPFGYQYLALASTTFGLVTCIFYLWNRNELPALLDGSVSARTPRVAIVADVMSMNGNSTVFGTLLMGRENERTLPADGPRSPVPARPDVLRALAAAPGDSGVVAQMSPRTPGQSPSLRVEPADRTGMSAADEIVLGYLHETQGDNDTRPVTTAPTGRGQVSGSTFPDESVNSYSRLQPTLARRPAVQAVPAQGGSLSEPLMRTPPRARPADGASVLARPSAGVCPSSPAPSGPPADSLSGAAAVRSAAMDALNPIVDILSGIMTRPRTDDGAPVAHATSDADEDMMAGWTGQSRGR